GSHLFIDGEHVVNNGDIHGNKTVGGTIELDAGRHALEATFFERAGGESMKVEWAGPDIPRGTIPASLLSHAALVYRAGDEPFERHEAKAKRGAQLFLDLGCATCHMTGDPAIDGQSPVAATPLAKLAGQRGAGCLSGDRPRIRFDREGDQEAVRGLLGKVGSLGLPLDHETAVAYTLDRMNCYACHQRKDFGGTHPKVAGYFGADEGAELGDEGRIPPHLSQVGAKLTSAWLQEVLLHGGTSRPYMHTRMPQFGADNVGHLVDLFPRADPPAPERKDWDISPDILADGHTLVGKGHLGCVQCHTFGGQRSLGVQAVDLTTMVDRIRYPWFRELMRDPKALNMDTRMPSFWPDGESPSPLLEGDPDQQIEAVWAFLSLGEGMAVPAGIATSATAFELVPAEEPLMAGVFMQDVSPRTLVVGFPERVHYAYDMQNSRVAKLWRGRFFNTKGTWDGRAGQLELPPSDQVLDLPPGPAFARLADIGADWPMAAPRPLGRKLTPERVPVLRYAIGHVTIEERLEPELRFGGSILKRHITVSSDGPVSNLYFRPFAWSSGGDQWSAPEKLEGGALRYGALSPAVELKLDGAATPTAVVGTGVDLRIPVQLVATASGYRASFTVEVSW
ncbi:MAG: hypothetical protein O2816_16340, partial [Planctomycetota bacterium]|nr:hypothetical protein [Planctomycetota bacterium]